MTVLFSQCRRALLHGHVLDVFFVFFVFSTSQCYVTQSSFFFVHFLCFVVSFLIRCFSLVFVHLLLTSPPSLLLSSPSSLRLSRSPLSRFLLFFFLFCGMGIKWPVGRHRVHLCTSPPQLYVSVSVRARVHTEAQRVLPLPCSVAQSGRLGPACLALCRRCRSRPTMFFAKPTLPGVAHGFCQIPALFENSGLRSRLWYWDGRRSSGQHLPLRGSEPVCGVGFPSSNWLCNQRHCFLVLLIYFLFFPFFSYLFSSFLFFSLLLSLLSLLFLSSLRFFSSFLLSRFSSILLFSLLFASSLFASSLIA